MTNPYSAGGGGTHLEARVAASALVAVLCGAPFRSLPGLYATEVRTQCAAFGEPLDDLIIQGTCENGLATHLHLQIKNRLTFTESDSEWADILGRAWDTFVASGGDTSLLRYGTGLGTYNARIDQHYQTVLTWAAESIDGDHFLERIGKKDFSHQDKRAFVETIRIHLTKHLSRPLSADELWRFLKGFVILHFDFQTGDGSRDAASVVDRLGHLLSPAERGQARSIWDNLVAKAGELIPAGGGASRATLVEHLIDESLPTGTAPSYWSDIQAIHRESLRALGDITSAIAGLRLHRDAAHRQVREALDSGGFIQIIGEPGAGKSAILKAIAEESARLGPVFVLKDQRIHPRGWSAHAHTLEIRDDIGALLREFACCGVSILFIDGIDKITDPAVQLTVNDVLRAIVTQESLSNWRVLATVREQNLKHLETWLHEDVLAKLPLRSITVAAFSKAELDVVGEEIPRLRPLLAQSGSMDVVLKRPFFLKAIAGLTGQGSAAHVPATEVELLQLWWTLGGSDRSDFSPAQHRRNALLDLAQRLAQSPNSAITIRNLAPEPLAELISAGVLRENAVGHSVVFAHDIYEEWALCEVLVGEQESVAAYLQQVGQPQTLVRPMQLLGAYVLETTRTREQWKVLLEQMAAPSLQPVWQRAVLTSCFQSTRTAELLDYVTDELLKNGGELLQRLLLAIATLEVIPNPLFLDEQLVPDMNAAERARFAHYAALPKPIIWVRFLDWLVPRIPHLPPSLIPDLLPVLATWQSNYAGGNIRHCREIGGLSYHWLIEFESACHPIKWKDRRDPFGIDLPHDDEEKIEKSLRSLFLSSAGNVPELAAQYLREMAQDKRRRKRFRAGVIQNCGALVKHLPAEFVDFFLKAFIEKRDAHRDPFGSYDRFFMEKFGIADHQQFYPASPIQAPFLALLRHNEEQGLRLVHVLCNHAISVWRWARSRGSYRRESLTPLPVRVTLPWGRQTFWGDNQTYLWFRGYWGNDAVKSALMALEQWAFEQIEMGADFGEVFRKAIQGNDTVAVLGLGVSLCLAYPEKAVACSVGLVTCPHLWEWDIARFIQDRSTPSNEIGNWYQYEMQLKAVRALNRKPHRGQDVRSLAPRLFMSNDAALKRTYLRGIRSFPKRLPFLYEEEKQHAEHVAALREKMQLFSEQGDPKYLKAAQTPDGTQIQIWIEPPSLQQPQYQEQRRENEQLNEFSGLALWAVKSLENGQLHENLTVEHAIAKGKELDGDDIFDGLGLDFLVHQRAAAVAGAAFVTASYCEDGAWTDEIGDWCLDVFGRAATGPEEPDDISIRDGLLVMHPAVFAAHGYSALLARGFAAERCMNAILSLAVDALAGVVEAVFISAKAYAVAHPKFYWTLLDIGLRQCVLDREEIPEFHSIAWDKREAARNLSLLERADTLLQSQVVTNLPDIPMPWIKTGQPVVRGNRETDGYDRNDTIFMFNLAEKILFKATFDPILNQGEMRPLFLRLLDQLMEWNIQEIVPPFATSRREHLGDHTPFEWVFGFSAWCGKVCSALTPEECRQVFLQRIFAQDNETALLVMQSLMRSFMINAFLVPSAIKDAHVALWKEMAEWVFSNPEWRHRERQQYLDREFQSCAQSLLFCMTPDFSPKICGIAPNWPHWGKFMPIIERAIREFGLHKSLFSTVAIFLKNGGADLLPDPALGWLHDIVVEKKRDLPFWNQHGDHAVEIIKSVVEKKAASLTAEHQDMISLIADILVDNGVRGAGSFQQELLRASQ
ncbi:hypothetical protein HNR59_001713 [Aquamicrobium lusatiense]|uniref:AAA+ ATPase domain-containing protein n=1 Tax=Aquamicrobium lusatiense TaxID=89772 RepID=A0A7W9S3J1_9HYPH|nr:hypothetical protein [Aquamicrobium lusatiense]